MKARIANTIPLNTPAYVPPGACDGLNVWIVMSLKFEISIHADNATKTAISKTPRITPAFVEIRTSR